MYGQSTSYGGSVDATFLFIVAVAAFFLVLVTTLMIVFAVRYRRSRHPRAAQISGSVPLEIIWTVIPVGLVMLMFYFGFEDFRLLRRTPEDAMLVKVTGRMWEWAFRYENGKETDKLYVPIDRPIKLAMTSADVIHSFFIPAFRVKEDVLPGRETYLWFKPQSTGPADIYCAEYCGQKHAYMMSEVIVLGEDEFEAWYSAAPGDSAVTAPVVALMDKHGCLDCHRLTDEADIGPPFMDLYGSERTVIVDGNEEQRIANEAYLRRAILEPSAEYVAGFERNMPVPQELTDDDVRQIIEYLKTLESR